MTHNHLCVLRNKLFTRGAVNSALGSYCAISSLQVSTMSTSVNSGAPAERCQYRVSPLVVYSLPVTSPRRQSAEQWLVTHREEQVRERKRSVSFTFSSALCLYFLHRKHIQHRRQQKSIDSPRIVTKHCGALAFDARRRAGGGLLCTALLIHPP